ncbi:hypothetical protein RIF29_18722 [Crotalaria pallida]|uniref:Uncharacterized protein n=1 Tax=Crotalaria pallida TaxID=3830 RepID=A0AAN9EYP2_CROPI
MMSKVQIKTHSVAREASRVGKGSAAVPSSPVFASRRLLAAVTICDWAIEATNLLQKNLDNPKANLEHCSHPLDLLDG